MAHRRRLPEGRLYLMPCSFVLNGSQRRFVKNEMLLQIAIIRRSVAQTDGHYPCMLHWATALR